MYKATYVHANIYTLHLCIRTYVHSLHTYAYLWLLTIKNSFGELLILNFWWVKAISPPSCDTCEKCIAA